MAVPASRPCTGWRAASRRRGRGSQGPPGPVLALELAGLIYAVAVTGHGVSFTRDPGAGGALPPLFTTDVAAFRVAESQALNTSGGT